MRLLHFILSHSIFVACCAMGLCFQTNVLLDVPHNKHIYGFIFFSTVCSYNFYWLLSKLYFSNRKLDLLFIKNQYTFFTVFVGSAIGTFYFTYNLLSILPFILVGVFFTLLYSMPLWPFLFTKKLQQAGFFKTLLLSLTWSYITTFLPVLDAHHTFMAASISVWLLFATSFFFMLLLCIIFDRRDISIDKINGLHSLATDVSMKKLNVILVIVFSIHLVFAMLFCFYFANMLQAVAFIMVGFIFWRVYFLSLKKQGYRFYYFLVDGLMLLSTMATFIASKL